MTKHDLECDYAIVPCKYTCYGCKQKVWLNLYYFY